MDLHKNKQLNKPINFLLLHTRSFWYIHEDWWPTPKHSRKAKEHTLVINNATVFPYLPTRSIHRIHNTTHSDHRTSEVPEKQALALTISLHKSFCCIHGQVTGEQNLIRTQKTFPLEEVLEIIVVEDVRRVPIKGSCYVSISSYGTNCSQIRQECRFKCCIRRSLASKVEQPVSEEITFCLSKGVSSFVMTNE